MDNINYTIIIPHKNIPQLLQRCLDSIPVRDDVQVIVVDDNSDTDKVDFNNFPKWRGVNYEYYLTKEGKGAGYARNVGLERAKGKWVLFADADDYFNYCINDILNEYINKEEDVIYFDTSSQDSYLYTNANRSTYTHQMITLYKKNVQQGEFQLRYYLGVPWAKIIKHEIITKYNIKFDETPINNDTTFAYYLGLKANKIAIDERALYCITVRSDSISYNLSDEKILASIDVFARKYRTLLNNNINVFEGFIPYHMNNALLNNRKDLYNKGLVILKQYGFDKSLLSKKSWQPPFFDEDLNTNSIFLHSSFGQKIIEAYNSKNIQYKIISIFLYITNKLRKNAKIIF